MSTLKREFKRSELDRLEFGTCRACGETICWAQHKAMLKIIPLDPKPVGGTEIDAVYARHWCEPFDER